MSTSRPLPTQHRRGRDVTVWYWDPLGVWEKDGQLILEGWMRHWDGEWQRTQTPIEGTALEDTINRALEDGNLLMVVEGWQ